MNIEILGRDYNDKSTQKAVMTAWEEFLLHGECISSAVRAVVKASWQRCLDHGVGQTVQRAPVARGASSLEELRHLNSDLLSALGDVEANLTEILKQTGSLLLLSDSRGVVIHMSGDSKVINAAKSELILPGYGWCEDSAGTNAIGTAIELKQAVAIHAVEHFCEPVKRWSCSAAPIMDTLSGELLGVIDVTTLSGNHSLHNMAVAVTASQQIEEILHSRQLIKNMQLIDWYHEVGPQWKKDGIILLDQKGRTIKTNPCVEKLISASGVMADFTKERCVESLTEEAILEQYAKALPETARPLSLESFNSKGQWQGGILVVVASASCSRHSLNGVAHEEKNSICPEQVAQAFSKIISQSQEIQEVKDRARRVAMTNAPVLILGETGCGKELFANAIHDASEIADKPFVAVNCGAFTKELVSSELFGYEGGAFTGANPKGRAGKFEEADGGTIFLDEIGELPLDIQVTLLRILQDGVVERIGGTKKRKVNTRIIAATNRNLLEDVGTGRFRRDLYYRLKVMTLYLPPLRERPTDIDILASTFMNELAQKYHSPGKSIHPELAVALRSYDWPGNVRELRSALESMFALSDSPSLTRQDLPTDISNELPQEPMTMAHSDVSKLCEVERQTIVAEIECQDRNLTRVAKHLGIARSTLYRKMEEYHIDRN